MKNTNYLKDESDHSLFYNLSMISLTFHIISFLFFSPRHIYLHAIKILYLFLSPGFLKNHKRDVLVHILTEVKIHRTTENAKCVCNSMVVHILSLLPNCLWGSTVV